MKLEIPATSVSAVSARVRSRSSVNHFASTVKAGS